MIGPIGWEKFDDKQTDDRQTTDRQTDRRQTDDRQTTDRQTDRQIESLYGLGHLHLLRRPDNNYKVDVHFPHTSVQKLHTQACEIVGGTKKVAV